GCTYLAAGVLPSAVVAVPVALLSDSLVSRVGLVVVAAGWLGTAVAALRAIRAGDVAAHRAWMTRNYALTFLAVTARIVVPLLLLVGLLSGAIAPAEMPTAVASLIPAGQIAGCAINLAVAEVVLRRARRGPTGSGPPRAAQAPGPVRRCGRPHRAVQAHPGGARAAGAGRRTSPAARRGRRCGWAVRCRPPRPGAAPPRARRTAVGCAARPAA